MAFITPGSNIAQRIVFNSGSVDFGSNRIVDVDNVAISIEWTVEELYVLGSIKPQDLVRHTQKVTMTGKVKSFPAEVQALALGAIVSGSPMELDTYDGQPTVSNPVVTLNDRNGKEYQYQMSGAIFKSSKLTAKMEDFAEFDIEIEAKDISLLYTA